MIDRETEVMAGLRELLTRSLRNTHSLNPYWFQAARVRSPVGTGFLGEVFCGPGGSSGKALSCGLDGPGSIPSVGGVEIFLHSFVSRLALGSTQPPIK